MKDVKLLGEIREGTIVQVNGKQLKVVSVTSDGHGCEQWTLAWPKSECDREHGPAEAVPGKPSA